MSSVHVVEVEWVRALSYLLFCICGVVLVKWSHAGYQFVAFQCGRTQRKDDFCGDACPPPGYIEIVRWTKSSNLILPSSGLDWTAGTFFK